MYELLIKFIFMVLNYFIIVHSNFLRNSGSIPIGSITGRHFFAVIIANLWSNSAYFINIKHPVVPALCAPAKQCI